MNKFIFAYIEKKTKPNNISTIKLSPYQKAKIEFQTEYMYIVIYIRFNIINNEISNK